jgi:hypothetical protein
MTKIIDFQQYNFENHLKECLNSVKDADLNTEYGKELLMAEILKMINEMNKMLVKEITDLHKVYMEKFDFISETYNDQEGWNRAMEEYVEKTKEYHLKQDVLIETLVNNLIEKMK